MYSQYIPDYRNPAVCDGSTISEVGLADNMALRKGNPQSKIYPLLVSLKLV